MSTTRRVRTTASSVDTRKSTDCAAKSHDDFYREHFAPDKVYVNAQYHEPSQELPEDQENPFILALPPFADTRAIILSMRMDYSVAYNESCRKWSLERKLLAASKIQDVLVVLPVHWLILEYMYISIRNHYRELVPAEMIRRGMAENYKQTQEGTPRMIQKPTRTHAPCYIVIGLSGLGKTTLALMCLHSLPIVIHHEVFRRQAFRFSQLVYVYVSCPHDGSELQLLRNILDFVDKHLDTHYLKEMARADTVRTYIQKIEAVFNRHFVGLLVIDELNAPLLSAAKREREDFVTSFQNAIRCPIIALSTPDARHIIQKTIRVSRRLGCGGCVELLPLENDEVGSEFATQLVRMDFLPKSPKNPEKMTAHLIEVGAGLCWAMKLAWHSAQVAGIRDKDLCMTEELLEAASKETFGLVEGLLDALRKRDFKRLSQFKDVAVAQFHLSQRDASIDSAAQSLYGNTHDEELVASFAQCVSSLMELGCSEFDASKIVRNLIADQKITEKVALMRAALVELEKLPEGR